jgi:hypothetical protein
MAIDSEKIASLVKEQLPEFVRADYQTFVAFIEAYFEFLEQDQGARDSIRNAQKYEDIDGTIDAFIGQFKLEFGKDIPEYILADKKNLYKNIKDFYQSKGSEKSYELLFRLLYNENISFFYPSTILLRPSDGKWTNDKTIRVSSLQGDAFKYVSTKIVGQTSGATAVVENVLFFQDGPNEVYELFLNIDSITGTFVPNEEVWTTIGLSTLKARIQYSFTGATITSPGTGYSIGDVLTVTGGSGVNAAIKVNNVFADGGIKSVQVTNFGSGYDIIPSISAALVGDGNATLSAIAGALCEYEGYYIGVDGQVSENIKLQDSKYYQAFSYVVRVGQSINLWRDIVKTVLHPAGLALFGEVSVTTSARARLYNGGSAYDISWYRILRLLASAKIKGSHFEPTIFITTRPDEAGNYPGSPVLAAGVVVNQDTVIIIPNQTLETLLNVTHRSSAYGLTILVNLSKVTDKVQIVGSKSTVDLYVESVPGYGFGTNYGTVDKFKYRFAPYTAGTQQFWGPTSAWGQNYAGTGMAGYWDFYANTQVKDIGDMVIGDIINKPKKKYNLCPEPYVTITN